MIPQITLQLYSVRDLATQDYAGTLRVIADIGFGCVETAGYPGTTAKDAAKLFQELGLKAPSAHLSLPIGEAKNATIEEALMMGHKYLITGCPPKFQEHFKSLDGVKAMAELYCEAADNLKPHGMQIGYHNHDWDLASVEGRRAYQVFLENTPETVVYEADVFWVARAGLDPAAFIREIGVRGKVMHFKDGIVSSAVAFEESESDAIPFRPAGQGQVDLLAAAQAARHADYLAVELDSLNGDMMQAIRDSYRYLTANQIARGSK